MKEKIKFYNTEIKDESDVMTTGEISLLEKAREEYWSSKIDAKSYPEDYRRSMNFEASVINFFCGLQGWGSENNPNSAYYTPAAA